MNMERKNEMNKLVRMTFPIDNNEHEIVACHELQFLTNNEISVIKGIDSFLNLFI